MARNTTLAALWLIGLAATAVPAIAADVTPQRLVNARSEPHNWLMIHHDYDNSRHSALKDINRDTVKNLALKYTFSIGGRSTGGVMRGKEESTPLVDDGFMYVADTWSRVMKLDVRSGTETRLLDLAATLGPVEKMLDPDHQASPRVGGGARTG